MGVMIWPGMCGSGRRVGMIRIKTHTSCVAGRGAVPHMTAVARLASGTLRTSGTTLSDFVAPGLNLFPFTLLPFERKDEERKDGVLEHWRDGVLEGLKSEKTERRRNRKTECWSAGEVECWKG